MNNKLKYMISSALVPFTVYAAENLTEREENLAFAPGTHSLVSPSFSIKNFDCLSQAVYTAPSNEAREEAIMAIRDFVGRTPEDIYSVDLLEVISEYTSLLISKYEADLYRRIIETGVHPKIIKASKTLFHSFTTSEQEIGRLSLYRIAQDIKHPHCWEAIEALSKHISTRRFTGVTIVDKILFEIIKDTKHPNCMQAILKLRVNICGDKILSDVLWKALVLIAQDSDHPDFYSTAKSIWERGPTQYHASVLPIFRKIAQDIHHPKMYDSILLLRKSEDQEDKALHLLGLRMIATDTHHPAFISANYSILLMEDGNEADKEIARLKLYPIAQDICHPQHWRVIEILLYFPSDADIAIVTPLLCIIGNDVNNPHFRSALEKVWIFGNEDGKATVRQQTYRLVREGGREAIFWSENLVNSSNEDDRILARQSLYTFADDINDFNQKRAINCLRESNDPESQRLGMALHLKYFSVDITPDTNMRMAQFNREAIRAVMPSSLQDLSADPMDIVTEFDRLIRKISPHEKIVRIVDGNLKNIRNPYCVFPSAITGDSYIASLFDIKNGAMGFLKTLTGQPLCVGEAPGWQMDDKNKLDMINSLKHIVHALTKSLQEFTDTNDDEGIHSCMLSLGIVLNGILYCPTGQAEGIESAVNALIYRKNVGSKDVKERVGIYIISSAVQKAFYNAFHQGGGVHGLSRARLVLSEELGLNHAIGSFKERISPVSDEEMPGFFNNFYQDFTPRFILDEARRNLQTPEEAQMIVDGNWNKTLWMKSIKRDITTVKQKKPLSVAELHNWLYDQAVPKEGFSAEHFGISEDYASIVTVRATAPLFQQGDLVMLA